MAKCDTCKANNICDHNKYGFENCGNYIPTDVVEVKHGEWLLDGRCSECLANPLTTHKSYCPNCGAKMRKEDEGK